MVYMGSKNRLSKYLKPIIEGYLKSGMIYIEPFVGGANMIDKIEWIGKYGYDLNKSIIALLKYGAYHAKLSYIHNREFKLPPEDISVEEFKRLRDLYKQGIASPKIGFAGLMCQLGTFYSSYQNDKDKRDQLRRNLEKQFSNPLFFNTQFEYKNYKDLKLQSAVIYCDPPYPNTTQYNIKEKFDYDHFLSKCDEWYKDGNIVLLSGNFIPNRDWRVLFEKDYTYNMYNVVREVKELLMIYEPKKHPNCWFWNHHRQH